jgi:nitrite reductase/ring-hydroxylating ferredoxin subunit
VTSSKKFSEMAFHWIKIYESQQELEANLLPQRLVLLELMGEKICLSRNNKGTFAVQDKCPHNGASLSRGFCSTNNEIICPLHRYSYDLSSGKATSGGAYALKTFPIEIKDDGVWLGIKAKWWEL